MTIIKQADLYYKQGNSDKEYHLYYGTNPTDGTVRVWAEYGRRGGTLAVTVKMDQVPPASSYAAEQLYESLLNEKRRKGYVDGAGGTPYSQTLLRKKKAVVSKWAPQLLNPISADELESFFTDPKWWMECKHDGKRIIVEKTAAGVQGINRNGLYVEIPQTIIDTANKMPGLFVLDGEACGEVLQAFDILEYNGRDLRSSSYAERKKVLVALIAAAGAGSIYEVFTSRTEEEKRTYFEFYSAQELEGVVFKLHEAAYTPGRPNSGGSQRKYKFYTTASCIVSQINTKRSVGLQLFLDPDDDLLPGGLQRVDIGNCTIPPNFELPELESIVEIRYLYAYPNGSLYQPVYLGIREDIEAYECLLSQLKYKAPSI